MQTGPIDCVYGLLGYSTPNLGDDIQSLAVKQLLPRLDFIIDRDFLGVLDLRIPAKMVLNGWFCHLYRRVLERGKQPQTVFSLLSSGLVQLLVTSFNCDLLVNGRAPELETQVLQFLERHQPIGCRDTRTLEVLTANGLSAYFSGCMSLLLRPRDGIHREGILEVDSQVPVNVEKLPRPFTKLHRCTQTIDRRTPFAARFDLAAERLLQIQQSEVVVTSRLHVALPCVAYGVPVVFVACNIDSKYRVADYIDFFDCVVNTEEELVRALRSPIQRASKPRLADLQSRLRSRLQEFLAPQVRFAA